MIVFPNIKINIGLNIVGKRCDGYHNLETVFYPVGLCDALELVPSDSGKNSFQCEGIDLNCAHSDNLVVKAYDILKADYDLPNIDIELIKRIPSGAGLGGGSSDASFMLRALNALFDMGLSNEQLKDYALKLGADCPFFIENKPMYATGIGEIMVDVNLSLKGYYILIVKPDIFISTKEAFAGVEPHKNVRDLKNDILLPVEEWKYCIKNDFEESIFPNHPELENIKSELYNIGAKYASMSGSGSAIYGLFDFLPDDIDILFSNCYLWSSLLD